MLPGMEEIVKEKQRTEISKSSETICDFKQSTMHDNQRCVAELVQHVRPSIVNDEGESAQIFAPEVVVELL